MGVFEVFSLVFAREVDERFFLQTVDSKYSTSLRLDFVSKCSIF